MKLARQRGGEVETETVHVHFGDPIAQRIHEQLEHAGVLHVQRVSRARVIRVEAVIVLHEPVVGGVVDPAEAERRAHVVAFARMIVDDVEDDLDPGRVEGLDHFLELTHLLAGAPVAGVSGMGREVADGIVAPVIGEAFVLEKFVVYEVMHRQQFDRGDAELLEILDGKRMSERRVGPAQFLGMCGQSLENPLTWTS